MTGHDGHARGGDALPPPVEGFSEQPLTFGCGGATLFGIAHAGATSAERGMLIVVGGPQTRVGSHRQFVLLARRAAQAGIPVLRFDYRGMGDSEGDLLGFEAISDDIRAAIDAFVTHQPSIREVVIWGLCDAASAALFYAHADSRVTGLVLLNPWVHTEQGQARAYLRHWYIQRLVDPGFWRRVVRGEFRPLKSLVSLWEHLREARGAGAAEPLHGGGLATSARGPLPERMAAGFERFRGRMLLVLSGRDLTAREFQDALEDSARWKRSARGRDLTRVELPQADHTFSTAASRAEVEKCTLDWLDAW